MLAVVLIPIIMTNTQLIKKVIGSITPIGQSGIDAERLENLKAMCELVNDLVTEIDNVAYRNKDSKEHSVKIMADYAKKFISETLGVVK